MDYLMLSKKYCQKCKWACACFEDENDYTEEELESCFEPEIPET